MDQEVKPNVWFAPIGLLDMFNSGGALEDFKVAEGAISVGVRGCGRFGAYSSQCPMRCAVDGVESAFDYHSDTGLLTLDVPVPQKEMYRWQVEIQV